MDRVGIDALRCKIFSPTLYEPAMAPPGRQIVILQKVLEMDYDRIEDWPAHKARTEAFLLEELERRIPGISERIVVKTSASAHTSWRFTLNHQGAMLGWEMSPDQLGAGRPDITSGIPNLFLVGHWTRPGGGITPVIISAQEVARKVAGALR
jgi:prolycopene isomerase